MQHGSPYLHDDGQIGHDMKVNRSSESRYEL